MMKRIHLLSCLMLMLFITWSCEERENLDPVGEWELSDPAIVSPDENISIVLNEDEPASTVRFEWAPAVSSKNYNVFYSLVLDTTGNTDLSTPVLRVNAANSGKELYAERTHRQLDQALAMAGYPAGSTAELSWTVVAQSIDRQTVASRTISITRFATEASPTELYISGAATEAGIDLSNAIAMKAFKDADGNPANVFELYTHLKGGESFRFYSQPAEQSMVYGGEKGALAVGGKAVTAPEEGEYRITVDFNESSYSLLKIDKWSVVGGNIEGGWGGDAALAYKGGSVWQGSIDLVEEAGFVFRANDDWAYLLKRIKGTQNELAMESQAESQGIEIEDIPSAGTGRHIFTLSLKAGKYTYTIEEDEEVVINPPSETPDQLFLLQNGELLTTFVKDGNTFKSEKFVALQAGTNYSLNSAEDGSGTSFGLESSIGESTNPDGDAVSGNSAFGVGNGALTAARDQAYQLTVNFETATVGWKHYNMKLFHWNDWETRDEFLMTYEHPYTYKVTADLTADYDLKFNSPWEVEFGADDPSALAGTMTHGGENFKNITSSGTYEVRIEVSDDYKSGTYEFVAQ